MFPDDSAAGGEQGVEALDGFPEGKFRSGLIVGRVEKDQVKGGDRGARDPGFHRGIEDGELVPEGGEVLPEGRGGTKILFDKKG